MEATSNEVRGTTMLADMGGKVETSVKAEATTDEVRATIRVAETGVKNYDDDDDLECRTHMVKMTQGVDPPLLWISDSGASNHFSGHREWFTHYEELVPQVPIRQTDGKAIMAIGKGTVTLDAWLNKEWVSVDLKDVMYIPGAANLFSEAAMDKLASKS